MGETPLDGIEHLARMDRGNAEGIESGSAVVEEEDIRAGVLAVARIDAFVLAIVNPEPVKNHRHTGITSCGAEFIARRASRAIHGNSGKRPLFRPRG